MNEAAEIALEIYRKTLEAIRADRLVERALRLQDGRLRAGSFDEPIDGFKRIHVLGAGKAVAAMAQGVERILGPHFERGLVVTKHGHSASTQRTEVLEAGHPVPDEGSLEAGRRVFEAAGRAEEGDLVLFLLSGGASSLMELPREGIGLDDLRQTTSLLLRAGANINQLNAVRSCLSQLKAGGLGRAVGRARVLCLVLSDVLGNSLEVIGSGPFQPHRPDHDAAIRVLEQFGVWELTPPAVTGLLEQRSPPEMPVAQAETVIIGDLWTALKAAEDAAKEAGMRPFVMSGGIKGEARELGARIAGLVRGLPKPHEKFGINCLIFGGEPTVTVLGTGKGGRCQEFACAAAPLLAGSENTAILAAGTDGNDGPTDAAGAVITPDTHDEARKAGWDELKALRASDTYHYLQSAGALIKTGPTQSNVGDIILALAR
ncbi:MAG TPA: DUF4147 domain-containing protein [Fimbriimonadaceae bacterium]|nr:DUF4147 domain-containing protein [Fimbriimonadaceae bacterium]